MDTIRLHVANVTPLNNIVYIPFIHFTEKITMFYKIVLILELCFLVSSQYTQVSNKIIINTQTVLDKNDAAIQELACINNYAHCTFNYTINELSNNNNWLVTLNLKRYLCSKHFSETEENKILSEKIIIKNGIWKFLMQVGECITISSGVGQVIDANAEDPISNKALEWHLMDFSTNETRLNYGLSGFEMFLPNKTVDAQMHALCQMFYGETSFNCNQNEYLVIVPCDWNFVWNVQYIRPFRTNNRCKYYMHDLNFQISTGYTIALLEKSEILPSIEIKYRVRHDLPGLIRSFIQPTNLYFEPVPDFFAVNISLLPKFNNLPFFKDGSFVWESNFNSSNYELGINIYNVTIFGIKIRDIFYYLTSPNSEEILFAYPDVKTNTIQNENITLYVTTNTSNAPTAFIRRWAFSNPNENNFPTLFEKEIISL